ncbi:MAG TPA: potassium channel family protein, partial [Thermoguttaceae bacterium]|nr:potassium channel family protein [Thermoguttaceae bacterium]
MKTPLDRMRTGIVLLGTIIVVSVFGYRMAGWSLLDSLYMVVITLSTVGYKEVQPLTPATQLLTIGVIVVGVSTALYIIGGLVQMMAEGEINRALGMRRVTKEIERLTDHIVLCGFGRMGEILAGELKRQNMPFVILENDADRIAEALTQNYLEVNDDATEEEALI